jgi:hypothetical protein
VLAVAHFDPSAIGLLIAGGVVGTIFAAAFTVRFAATYPALPPPGPETMELGPESPAIANLLANRCSVTHAAEAATLVDLAARKQVELFEVGPDRFVVRLRSTVSETLTPYEHQVLALVREKATGGSAPLEAVQLEGQEAQDWHERFSKAVVRDAKSRGLLRGRWSRADWSTFGVLAAAALLLVAGGLFAAHVEDTRRAATTQGQRFHRQDWFWVAAIAWIVVLALIAALRSIRYSPSGRKATSAWLGVRRYLRRNPSFGDAPPAAVTIWGRVLSYATALGVARATAAAIPFAAEDPSTAWSRYGGDWHQVHVEYPRRFGYGEPPLGIFLGGLVRTLFWGGLAFAVLPLVADALWTFGHDQLNTTAISNAASAALVAAFFIVFGVMGLGLLAKLADGLVRTYRGGTDLRRTTSVEGAVVKVIERNGTWFAVDPGHVDHVKAWHPGEAPVPPRGATVRVALTPRLGHVKRVETLDAPAPSPAATPLAALPGSSVAPVSWSAPDATISAATVAACAGMSLPEVDPATLTGGPKMPPQASVRAFSDGSSHVLIGVMPAGSPVVTGLASHLTGPVVEQAERGRWTQDRTLVQLLPSGLAVVDVELAGRASAEREQVARALAAHLATEPLP